MPNQLAHETSPYLLQHKDNPVEWYPWGEEALERATQEEKPIFLSIGYSACHWCHVMEHESFEDEQISRQLNENFVCIKVDREERPDLDQIYMIAVQLMTGRGGWPMSVFLTPDCYPFYCGTYWPPHARGGMPGFDQVLAGVASAWQNRRDEIQSNAVQLSDQLARFDLSAGDPSPLTEELLHAAGQAIQRPYDPVHGGFGGAPKFPQPMNLDVLLRLWYRNSNEAYLQIVRTTLDKMAGGGIYDHLGGGFARYSVDAQWLVPHFEKMLYDNALLAGLYLDGFLATRDPAMADVARETLDYVLRDMTHPNGGFYSTEDADSEGEEGRFYLWTPGELDEVLGPDIAERFAHVYDVSAAGNFEGKNILNRPKTWAQYGQILDRDPSDLQAEMAQAREALRAAREKRVRPGRDEKIIVAWNGLMIDSLARAAGVLDDRRYLQAAVAGVDFLLDELRDDRGRLRHTWRDGVAKFDGYLDDYACLINALVSVYEAGFRESYIDDATTLADTLLEKFADPDRGGFFYTADDHEPLITRPRDMLDSSVPSGSSMAATALWRLGTLTGRQKLRDAAKQTLHSASHGMQTHPTGAGQMLAALDAFLGPMHQIVLVHPRRDTASDIRKLLAEHYIPNRVLSARTLGDAMPRSTALDELFKGRETDSDQPRMFVCQEGICSEPAVGRDAIADSLRELASP